MKKYWYRLLCHLPGIILNLFDFGRYKTWECKAGYIAPDGQPLICYHCGHKKFEEKNHDYLDGYGSCLLEYNLFCKKCKKIVGNWAYGYWCP